MQRIEDEARAAIAALYRTPWRWGQSDCTTWLGDYICARVGADPAAPYRGAYSDEGGAEALLAAHGGLVALLDQALAAVGVLRAETPLYGDVGVIEIPRPDGACQVPVSALYLGRRWCARSARGFAAFQRVPLAVWRVA